MTTSNYNVDDDDDNDVDNDDDEQNNDVCLSESINTKLSNNNKKDI